MSDNGEPIQLIGEEYEREATVPIDDWPEPGETVTFKAVGGEVEKTVADVNKDEGAIYELRFKEGGAGDRSNTVEYSRTVVQRCKKTEDGREAILGTVEGI